MIRRRRFLSTILAAVIALAQVAAPVLTTLAATPAEAQTQATRTRLTGPITLQRDTTNLAATWADLRDNYDLAGYMVTVQAAHGLYTAPLQLFGDLVGQAFPYQVQFICDPLDNDACLLQPTTADPVSIAYGARVLISGFTGDQSQTTSPSEGIFSVGAGSHVILGRALDGVGGGSAFTFANVKRPLTDNDITINGNGKLWVNANPTPVLGIDPPTIPMRLKWRSANDATKQAMFDIGDRGNLMFLTNGGVDAGLVLDVTGSPSYYAGIIRVAGQGSAILGAGVRKVVDGVMTLITPGYQGVVLGQQWVVIGPSSLATYETPGRMFGNVAGTPGLGVPAGIATVTIGQ